MRLAKYLPGLVTGWIAFAAAAHLNWGQLKNELNASQGDSTARLIVQNWSRRPVNFFVGIKEESWLKIIPLLTPQKIAEIHGWELDDNFLACQIFAKYLPEMSERESLPKFFRIAVYKYLANQNQSKTTNQLQNNSNESMEDSLVRRVTTLDLTGSFENNRVTDHEILKRENPQISTIFKAIPASWMQQDSKVAMKILVSSKSPQLGLLNDDSLFALLKDHENACKLITLSALKSLYPRQLGLVSPLCIAKIGNLSSMDLSPIIAYFPDNAFARYDYFLCSKTIEGLSGPQLSSYGRDFGSKLACTVLALHHTSLASFESVTSRCIYGYLSRKWGVGLVERWGKIHLAKLKELTPEMQNFWVNIHPGDFNFMLKPVRQFFLSMPHICADLDVSHLAPDVVSELSQSCLYAILSRPIPRIQLRRFWQTVDPTALSSFTDEMMVKLKKIDFDDFKYMSSAILDVILKSPAALENLPEPTCHIILPLEAKYLSFNWKQFSTVAKYTPSIAGQLLMMIEWPNGDILAGCDGETLRKLTCKVSTFETLEWDPLFAKLELVQRLFPEIVRFMCINSKEHFCSTIKNIKEYLSLPWLRRNMNDICRSVIGFDLNQASVFLQAPELFQETVAIRAILEKYSLEDWRGFFASKNFVIELGHACEFWSFINNERWDIMGILGTEILKSIKPRCVHRLGNFLKSNPNFIPLLDDHAFSTHINDDLPCKLRELSAVQIAHLSIDSIPRTYWHHATQGNDIHALFGVTLQEIKSLNLDQFNSLFKNQWRFVPKTIRIEALEWHLNIANSRLKFITEYQKELDDRGDFNSGYDLKEIIVALELYIELMKAGKEITMYRPNLALLVPAFRCSPFRDRFFKVLLGFGSSKALFMGLSQDAEEFYKYLNMDYLEMNRRQDGIPLPFNQQTGFDRGAIISYLCSSPELFASPTAKVECENINDGGGLLRVLVAQVLDDIQRDLIVEGGKFVWAISSQIGFLVGLLFGKALQLKMRLSFALDSEFLALLINTKDKAIESYYKEKYSNEVSTFLKTVTNLHEASRPSGSELLDILTKPEHIRFTTLSLEVDSEKARDDFKTKTNIWGCGKNEGFERVEDIMKESFLEDYFIETNNKVLTEFKKFVRKVFQGVKYILPSIESLTVIPVSASKPSVEFLSLLLSPVPIIGKNILDSVTFSGDSLISSFIPEESILASKVFVAFINSLEEEQLKHLLAIWTGASTISFERFSLGVGFVISKLFPVTLDFCEADKFEAPRRKGTPTIAPGKDYIRIFNRVVENLFGANSGIKPDCTPGGVEINLIRTEVCVMSLRIPLQSAQRLVNSLVDLLNTPINSIVQ